MKSAGFIAILSISIAMALPTYGADIHAESALASPSEAVLPRLILTIGSSAVYEPEFRYRLNYISQYYKAAHCYSEITDWAVKQNGMPLREYLLTTATHYACTDRAIEVKAAELSVTLSPQELADIQTAKASNIKIYGSESEYRRIVSSMYESEQVFDYLTKMNYLGKHLFERLYGAKGEQCSDECVSAYVMEQRFMAAKYIFLSAMDKTGKPLNAAQRKRNVIRLQGMLEQLKTDKDPPRLFTKLMQQHSQDASLLDYPNGRLFASGSKGDAFEQAYLKLADTQYSGIVKADEGDYLVMRMPIFSDMIADAEGNTLRYWAAYNYHFKNQVGEWCAKLPVTYSSAYEDMIQ